MPYSESIPYNATLTTVWDSGVTLVTKCIWRPSHREMIYSDTTELHGAGSLTREFVTFLDEDYIIYDEEAGIERVE